MKIERLLNALSTYRRERILNHESGHVDLPPEIEEGGLVEPFPYTKSPLVGYFDKRFKDQIQESLQSDPRPIELQRIVFEAKKNGTTKI